MGAAASPPSRSCCCSSSSSATSSAGSPPAPSRGESSGPRRAPPRRLRTARLDARARARRHRVGVVARPARRPGRRGSGCARRPTPSRKFTAAVVDRTTPSRDVVASGHRRAQPADELPLPRSTADPGIASSTARAPTTAASATSTTSASRPTPRRRRGWPTPPSTRSSPTASPAPRGAAGPGMGHRRWRGTSRSSTDGRHGGARSSSVATWPASRRTSTTSPSLGVGGLYLTPLFPAPSVPPLRRRHVRPRRPPPRWRRRADQPRQGLPQPGHPRDRRPHRQPRRLGATSGSGRPRPTPPRPKRTSSSSADHPDDYESWFDVPTPAQARPAIGRAPPPPRRRAPTR